MLFPISEQPLPNGDKKKKSMPIQFITFFAWQYSFSITFPRTHGRLAAPDAIKKNGKDNLNSGHDF